jgi:hypothetical protein
VEGGPHARKVEGKNREETVWEMEHKTNRAVLGRGRGRERGRERGYEGQCKEAVATHIFIPPSSQNGLRDNFRVEGCMPFKPEETSKGTEWLGSFFFFSFFNPIYRLLGHGPM